MHNGWLFDETINAVMFLLGQRDKNTYFMNSFLLEYLLHGGKYNYLSFRKRKNAKYVDISAYKKLIVPVNFKNTHWFLVVAHIPERLVEYVHHDTVNHVLFIASETYRDSLHLSFYLKTHVLFLHR